MGKVKIGDFLHRIKRPVVLNPNDEYRLVTIKMHHKGVILRGLKKGADIKSKMYEVKEGDFILSGIDARNGAFGIVSEDLDGAIVTNDFWYFKFDENVIDKHFFLELTSTSWFDEICRLGSDGTTQRIRLQKDKFFNQVINLPPLEEQQEFISKFITSKTINSNITNEIEIQQTLLIKLRQAILQDATEGKLTASWREQNPNVESASALLEKIKTEKEQLIKEKKIKKQKLLPSINEDETPFVIPDSWEWCRLGDIIDFFSDYHANGSYKILKENVELLDKKDYAIMLRTTNFHSKNRNNYKYINENAYNFLSKTKLYHEDIIMNKIADPGKVFLVEDLGMPMSLAMNLFLLRFDKSKISPKYVFNYLIHVYDYIVSFAAGSSTLTITKDSVNSLIIPLPPLEEQKEIVKKIENLFKICNEIETQINNSKVNSETLMQAILKEAFEG